MADLAVGFRRKALCGRAVTVPGGRLRYPVTYTQRLATLLEGLESNIMKDAMAAIMLDDPVPGVLVDLRARGR